MSNRIQYLQGCIREIGYEINQELNATPSKYGTESRDRRVASWRAKMETLHAEIATLR